MNHILLPIYRTNLFTNNIYLNRSMSNNYRTKLYNGREEILLVHSSQNGPLAQLVERIIRIDEVRSSTLLWSTKLKKSLFRLFFNLVKMLKRFFYLIDDISRCRLRFNNVVLGSCFFTSDFVFLLYQCRQHKNWY